MKMESQRLNMKLKENIHKEDQDEDGDQHGRKDVAHKEEHGEPIFLQKGSTDTAIHTVNF
jgi:hypothetical protein